MTLLWTNEETGTEKRERERDVISSDLAIISITDERCTGMRREREHSGSDDTIPMWRCWGHTHSYINPVKDSQEEMIVPLQSF